MMEIIAQPPPKVNAPILKNVPIRVLRDVFRLSEVLSVNLLSIKLVICIYKPLTLSGFLAIKSFHEPEPETLIGRDDS